MKVKKGRGNKGKKNAPVKKSRKEQRKEKRNLKKLRRRDYYSRRFKPDQQNLANVRGNYSSFGSDKVQNMHKYEPDEGYDQQTRQNIESETVESRRGVGNRDIYRENDVLKSCVMHKPKKYEDQLVVRKRQEEAAHQELQKEMSESRKKQLNDANEEEEKLIKKLEKQLKLSKRKSKTVPKSFVDDGLDYLLDVCDSDKIKDVAKLENTYRDSDSELEEDLALASGKSSSAMQHDEDRNFCCPGSSGLNRKQQNSSGASDNGFNGSDSESDSDFVDNAEESDSVLSSLHDIEDIGMVYFSSEEDEESTTRLNFPIEESGRDCNEKVNPKKLLTESSSSKGHSLKSKKKNVHLLEEDEDNDHDEGSLESGSRNSDKQLTKRLKTSLKKQKTSEKRQKTSQKRQKTSLITTSDGKKLKVSEESGTQPGRFVKMHHSDDDDASGDETNVSGVETNVSGVEVSETAELFWKGIWEDIYGRMRDKAGNIVASSSQPGAYVPPALRAQLSGDDAQSQQRLQRLNRQVRGSLNKLTESTLPSITNELDFLYRINSRSDMNSTLTAILMESLVSSDSSLKRIAMNHIALISCLHSKVGSDVGAYVLQAVAKKFNSLYNRATSYDNKKLDNVLLIICYLYHFKVVHACMLFDVLQLLAKRFSSKDVELILLMLRTVGFGLRKDDPVAMKSLMIQLQELATSKIQHCDESRVKFMLEVLVAVKNNNMARLPGWDPAPLDNLRKLVRAILACGNTSPELNISLQDLLQADEKGRWWVVGSAWVGQTPGAPEQQQQEEKAKRPKLAYSAKLLALAERMRMNTEVRRNIFCILMSADDYTEAFKNILQMGLKGLQIREVVHVTLDCCLQEKTYNKFYAHLLQSLCEHNRAYKMTLQCDLWKKFESLRCLTLIQSTNLVYLLRHLLILGVIGLVVFKVIDMTNLERPILRLLRQVLVGILQADLEECNKVFVWITKHPKYKVFARKLHLFLEQFLLSKMEPDNPVKRSLQERVDGIFLSQDQ